MKKIISIYAVSIASVIIGSCLNVVWTNNIPALGDFFAIKNTYSPYTDDTLIYFSLGDCLIAAGFILWAFGTGVWYQFSTNRKIRIVG